ncbi:hypothetical protein EK21DRAFT_100112 [Setomelanomma holmii]|uniref:Rhodopsin domain-containing protein n=1 Tax=Setomelanomma holmii TaxID=210430 RepID=A0A9P4LMK8_9PLEO|nr:hypothetical protein EK21DRAFT_100112 [Setomelanomma holmii]
MSGQYVDFGGVRVDISQLNFNDTWSRVESVQTTNIILIILVVVVHFFADDILIVVAAAFTLALAATCIAATRKGLGKHIWLFPLAEIFNSVKSCILFLFICQILYAFSIFTTKIAIISSYLRFIQARTFRMIMYITLAVTVGLWICGIFVTIFQCRPIYGAWDYTAQQSCLNYVDYLYASSSVNVLTDIVLCISPIPHLWRLKMPPRQRVILCILFAGGAGACVAGIARIAYLHNLRVLEFPFQSVPSLNLSVIECSLGIGCVSIPALRPMFVRLIPNSLRTGRASSAKTKPRSIPLTNLFASTSNRLPELGEKMASDVKDA